MWLRHKAQVEGQPSRKFIFGARACALSLCLAIIGSVIGAFSAITSDCTQHLKCTKTGRDLIAAMNGVSSFGAISGDFDTWAHLSDVTGASWDTRFNHLWMLPKFLTSDEVFTQSHQWILAYVAGAFAEDMNRRKPAMMFVDDADIFYHTPKYVNLIAYFSVFPEFKEAWRHYHFEHAIATCSHPTVSHCSFLLFRRTP
jgi:hypothetical protein